MHALPRTRCHLGSISDNLMLSPRCDRVVQACRVDNTVAWGVERTHAAHALQATLDSMHSEGEHLGELFEVLSAKGRRFGRHGVVQPVRRNADGADMAAKFYRDRAAFDAELRARSMLPRGVVLATKLVDHSTLRSGDSGSSVEWSPPAGGGGAELPPHIVMDLGVPLADWVAARGAAAEFADRVRVLEEVARRLATMHAAGWVHGAVKPGNILWRELSSEWLLTDVCDAALVGAHSLPLRSSLPASSHPPHDSALPPPSPNMQPRTMAIAATMAQNRSVDGGAGLRAQTCWWWYKTNSNSNAGPSRQVESGVRTSVVALLFSCLQGAEEAKPDLIPCAHSTSFTSQTVTCSNHPCHASQPNAVIHHTHWPCGSLGILHACHHGNCGLGLLRCTSCTREPLRMMHPPPPLPLPPGPRGCATATPRHPPNRGRPCRTHSQTACHITA